MHVINTLPAFRLTNNSRFPIAVVVVPLILSICVLVHSKHETIAVRGCSSILSRSAHHHYRGGRCADRYHWQSCAPGPRRRGRTRSPTFLVTPLLTVYLQCNLQKLSLRTQGSGVGPCAADIMRDNISLICAIRGQAWRCRSISWRVAKTAIGQRVDVGTHLLAN